MLTLDIAIATHQPDGIISLASKSLPQINNVKYIISWQDHRDYEIPEELIRDDVEIYRFNQSGQSLNRNNALEHCSADIVLNSDDDVAYNLQGIAGLIHAFEEYPDVDVATFRSEHGDMSRFPKETEVLGNKLPKEYSVSGIEIAFRRKSIGELKFCPEFGFGSPHLHGAEDEVFLLSAIKRGLRCRFFPITICSHPHESTGNKSKLTDENLMASGCFIRLQYPTQWILRICLKAYRNRKASRCNLIRGLFYLFRGALQAPGVLSRNKSTLW